MGDATGPLYCAPNWEACLSPDLNAVQPQAQRRGALRHRSRPVHTGVQTCPVPEHRTKGDINWLSMTTHGSRGSHGRGSHRKLLRPGWLLRDHKDRQIVDQQYRTPTDEMMGVTFDAAVSSGGGATGPGGRQTARKAYPVSFQRSQTARNDQNSKMKAIIPSPDIDSGSGRTCVLE